MNTITLPVSGTALWARMLALLSAALWLGTPAGAAMLPPELPPPDLAISSAPAMRPTAQLPRGFRCSGSLSLQRQVNVPLGKAMIVNLPEATRTRTIGNQAIAQALLLSPTSLYLLGSHVGTTNMLIQGRSGRCSDINVVVSADPAGLQQAIHRLLPQETGVQVSAAAAALVLSGTVSSASAAAQIVSLAHEFVADNSGTPPNAPKPGDKTANNSVKPLGVINMLQVAAPQQVMLQVKVAEVSKNLINSLGLSGSVASGRVNLLARLIGGASNSVLGFGTPTLTWPAGKFGIDFAKEDRLTKILAEPTLAAISGQQADFLAGGRVYLPIPQSQKDNTITVSLVPQDYGIRLKFTPTVLGDGKINLQVMAEVSDLNQTANSSIVSSFNGVTNIYPSFNIRHTATTIQLYDGQSFSIGGLLKDNISGDIKAIPGIGEMPILGALARSNNYQADKTELVFIVTPHLAKTLPNNYPLPTDSFGKVSTLEEMAYGNMEGKPAAGDVAPVLPAPANAPSASKASTPVKVLPLAPETSQTVHRPAADIKAEPAPASTSHATGQTHNAGLPPAKVPASSPTPAAIHTGVQP